MRNYSTHQHSHNQHSTKLHNIVKSTDSDTLEIFTTINTKGTSIKPEVSNVNKLWTTVKDLTNTATKAPPRNIIHNNTIVTPLKKIK